VQDSYKGVNQVSQIARVPGRKVYLYYRTGQVYLECELYDKPHQDSEGKVPPELHIQCPACGGESIIPGSKVKKTIHVEYLKPPRRLEMPDNGEVVQQTARVTVDEVCQCGYPDPAGKGKCGWRFKLTDNVVERV